MSRLKKPPKDSLYSVIDTCLKDLQRNESLEIEDAINLKLSKCSKSEFQSIFTMLLRDAAPIYDLYRIVGTREDQESASTFHKLTLSVLLRYSTLRQPYMCTDISVSKDLEGRFRGSKPPYGVSYEVDDEFKTDNVCTYVDMSKQSLNPSTDSSNVRMGILFIDIEKAKNREFYSLYVDWALRGKLQEVSQNDLYNNSTHLVYRIQYDHSRQYIDCELATVLFKHTVRDSRFFKHLLDYIDLDSHHLQDLRYTTVGALASNISDHLSNGLKNIEKSVALNVNAEDRKPTLESLIAQRELALEIDVAIKAVLTYRYGDFRGETKNFSTGFDKQRASQPKKTRLKKSKQKAKTPKPYAVTYLQSAELPWETANSVEAALEQEVNSLNADLQKQTPNTPNHYKKIWVIERYLKTHRIPESDVYLVDENRPRRNRYGEQVFKTRYLIKRLFIYDANSTDAPLDSAKVHVKRLTLKSLAKEDIDKGEGEGASPL